MLRMSRRLVTVSVDNVLDQTIDFPPSALSILENSAAGTSAGTLIASSTDGGTVTFEAAHDVFDVSSTGEITLKDEQSLDYETTTSYQIEVIASADDAPDVTETVAVDVGNVIDQTITFSPSSLSIPENSAAGTSAGTLIASSTDGEPVTFTATHDVFDVDSSTGADHPCGRAVSGLRDHH